MTKPKTNFTAWIYVLVLLAGLVWPRLIRGEATNNRKKPGNSCLPGEIESGLSYVLGLIQKKDAALDAAKISPLLEFAAANGEEAGQYRPSKRESGNGACAQARIAVPLERILRYEYNHRIPTFLVSPNVLRLSGWYPESDIVASKVELWNELSTLDKPLLLWGKAFEVTTPDAFSGACYRYDLDRLIILMKHNNQKVVISAYKMPHPSEAGEKAVIIDEENWSYFYSGIQGLGIRLIGMLDTYIYDSASVKILCEADSSNPQTTITIFSWLRAGWSDISMVKSSHVHAGIARFIEGFKEVLESDLLPPADALAGQLDYLAALPDTAIESKIREYAINLERIAKRHKDMSSKQYARLIADGGYAGVLNREERMGVLALEWLKGRLGKTTLVDIDSSPLLPKKPPTFEGTGLE